MSLLLILGRKTAKTQIFMLIIICVVSNIDFRLNCSRFNVIVKDD